jgi:hypothetical protein
LIQESEANLDPDPHHVSIPQLLRVHLPDPFPISLLHATLGTVPDVEDLMRENRDLTIQVFMAVSGHKTISIFKRYNMMDEEELRTLVFPIGTSVGTKEQDKKKKGGQQ